MEGRAPPLASAPIQMGTVRVLVVEDDKPQQMILQTLFEKANKANEGLVVFEISSVSLATSRERHPPMFVRICTFVPGRSMHCALPRCALISSSEHSCLPCLRVTVVGSAAEALSLLRSSSGQPPFDLILLDLMLPDKNGYEVLPELRALVGSNTAIVIASAHSHVRASRGGTDALDVRRVFSRSRVLCTCARVRTRMTTDRIGAAVCASGRRRLPRQATGL